MADHPPTADDVRRRADEIFFAALDLDSPGEQRARVERDCAGDARLRAEVDRLFAALRASDAFFADDPAAAPVSVTQIARALEPAPPGLAEAGQEIGPYTLVRKIGEGGVSEVFLAEQDDPIRRQVALKLIKPGMDTRSVIARFEAERQALALMDHPNIARVYDAGATAAGRPFFVMEWVRGTPITAYCDANRLDLRRRLELFVPVCRAVQHAHQKGIVHRDLKPSNLLVAGHDGEPRPLVIDFGIAKAVRGEPLGERTVYGPAEPFIGTPAYMSPEQAGAGDVDTRADIYSLGMVLHELLAGEPAFDRAELMAGGVEGMVRILREREAGRPSERLRRLPPARREAVARARAADPRRLPGMLRGELDWIVAKALEKDRARRYETADALAADLLRHLAHEPVEARPPSRGYRFGKMIRRNRGVFAALGALVAALAAGLGVSTWFWSQEHAARQRAVEAEQRAEHARRDEAALRREAESREILARAAHLLGGQQPQAAARLMDAIRVEAPSIEAAAVLRGLARWHAAQGDDAAAAARYRELLAAGELDGWEARANDHLAAAVVMARAGATAGHEALRLRIAGHAADAIPAQAAARLLLATLLRPADDATLAALAPLAARLTQPAPAAGERPEDWLARFETVSIGADAPAGLRADGGRVEFVMSGADIWDARDRFVFSGVEAAGDFDVRVRVHSIASTNGFARVGLMARHSLADAGSRHVMIAVNADNTFQALVRPRTGSWTLSQPPNPLPAARGENSWVRLQREGSVFRGYVSGNGSDWELLDAYDSASGADGPFADPVHVGFAGCSHAPGETARAVLSDFGGVAALSNDAMLAQALLHYRRGEFGAAAHVARRCLSHPGFSASRTALVRTLLAMAEWRLDNREAALAQLAQVRALPGPRFAATAATGADLKGAGDDRALAALLLHEAEALVR